MPTPRNEILMALVRGIEMSQQLEQLFQLKTKDAAPAPNN